MRLIKTLFPINRHFRLKTPGNQLINSNTFPLGKRTSFSVMNLYDFIFSSRSSRDIDGGARMNSAASDFPNGTDKYRSYKKACKRTPASKGKELFQ